MWSSPFSSSRHQFLLTVVGGLWIALIIGGTVILAREEFTPVKALAQGNWFPANSAIPLSVTQPTLILFAHPLCPCTRASFHELENLLAEAPGKFSVVIVFTVAEGLPSDWKQGDLWQSAVRLSGVQTMEDRNGVESRRFGVTGSGHCLLYSPSGTLLFSGGITTSRGHDGESPGRLALVSFVKTGQAAIHNTPVFGCSLL